MSTINTLLQTITQSVQGLTLADLLTQHSEVARRTAQRWIGQLIAEQRIMAVGQGRARRYYAVSASLSTLQSLPDAFPSYIPLSADSTDILAYIDQPVEARKPVGYQQDFLDSYQPNQTWYLSEPLRRQLRKMGDTGQSQLPAGTYGRAMLDRLLIDLSWASSHLEGNTYSRLDTRRLIGHGTVAEGKAVLETQMILCIVHCLKTYYPIPPMKDEFASTLSKLGKVLFAPWRYLRKLTTCSTAC